MMNGPGTWSAFATLMRTIGEPNSELEYFLAEAPPELGDHVLEYLDQPDINALSHASLVIRFSPPLRFYRRKERLEARIRAREQERGQESTMGPSSKLFRRRCGLSRADYNAAFTSTEVSDDKNRPPTATTSVNRAKHDDDPGASDDETYVPALHITPAVRQRILSTVCPEYNRQGIVIPEAPDLDRVPTEVLLMVYGRLDNIDACCLGLSSPHQYRIYRALFGTKIKLNTRRDGQAGTIEKSWEVVGKNQCPHCDPFRCQLYRHLEVWMGPKFEYCSVTKRIREKQWLGPYHELLHLAHKYTHHVSLSRVPHSTWSLTSHRPTLILNLPTADIFVVEGQLWNTCTARSTSAMLSQQAIQTSQMWQTPHSHNDYAPR